ncbi:MAG: 4Fe-4S binding protein [Desulfobaccales bacterium]
MLASIHKRETPKLLLLTLQMYQELVELRLDKTVCLKCEICSLVCPRGAVTVRPGDQGLDITIDPRLCVLCEICTHFCPTGAVTLTINGTAKTIFADQEGLASFYPKVCLDKGKCPEPCPQSEAGQEHWCRQQLKLVAGLITECPKYCHKCLAACPRQAIVVAPDGLTTQPEPDLCLRCTQCLTACQYDSLTVNPLFIGELHLDDSKCPPDCLLCIEACPVKAIVREGERVFRKTETCTYCGVCLNICDYEAITLNRRQVVAVPGEYSHAWEEAVRRLLSRKKAR